MFPARNTDFRRHRLAASSGDSAFTRSKRLQCFDFQFHMLTAYLQDELACLPPADSSVYVDRRE
ncbi:hypothetical protein A9O66_07610 [Paraburkholderia caribensis]|uniref:Uncharacterized protein n=1 Tax=Paraburkholderia caribensis TaxID=75105 RepID=A0A9Q6RZB3_9BURK|nr:hypothetical protein A9O66_07610 [Paraburkholderia caribensis]